MYKYRFQVQVGINGAMGKLQPMVCGQCITLESIELPPPLRHLPKHCWCHGLLMVEHAQLGCAGGGGGERGYLYWPARFNCYYYEAGYKGEGFRTSRGQRRKRSESEIVQ